MGTGKINVWITDVGRPSRISSDAWMVLLADCTGKLLEWCGRKYIFWAKCGHVEIQDVPPGCYVVAAARYIGAGPPVYFNWATDFTIARVNCGEVACVTLFAPSYQRCGYLLKVATKMLVAREGLPRDTGTKLVQAIDETLKYAPKPMMEMETAEFLESILKEQQKAPSEEQKQPKEA